MIDVNRNETISEEYKKYIDRIEPHKKIVYCSLGTVLELHQKKGGVNIKRFFEILLSVFSVKNDYHLIISMEETFKKQLGAIPKNVKIFEKVPQIDLLKRCDLFITHGGMNSILESATLGIPMLVFPLNEDWDQNGNAARIIFHQIGLMGNIKHDNAEQINDRIELLLTDGKYSKNVNEMSNLLKKYTSESFLEDFFSTELLVH